MKKDFNRLGKVPHTIKEGVYITPSINKVYYFCDSVSPSASFIDSTIYNKEWYTFLHSHDLLGNYILDMYKDRPFNSIIDDYCEPFSNGSSNDSDTVDLFKQIQYKAIRVYYKNVHKYNKLWEALTVDFNPLWNVDGVEEIVRTLERDGNIVNAKSGNDASAKTGNDALVKSGTITDAESGTTAEAHTGTITTTDTGTDTTIYTGTETDTKNGRRELQKTGGKTTTESEATTDSQTFLNVKKTVESYTDGVSDPEGEFESEIYTNLADVKTFNQRQDQVTKNLSNQQTNANTDTTTHGKTDTTTFNNTDTQNYNSTDTTTYNSSNTETIDTLDTERTRHERHGNIGVTTTTQLLTEYVEYAKLVDFVDIVARDILETITLSTY